MTQSRVAEGPQLGYDLFGSTLVRLGGRVDDPQ